MFRSLLAPLVGVLLMSGTAVAAPAASHLGGAPVTWRNVEIVAGGYVTGLQYHPTAKDLAYARTDIGGAYRWNPLTKRWIPLTDFISWEENNLLGVESIALDPALPNRVYLALGTYVQPWASNGAIVRSDDRGRTWRRTDLPIKLGGNESGRSAGERLVVDPNDSRVLYFGSRLDGLWRSTDSGVTWAKVESFPVLTSPGTAGISFVVADPRSGRKGSPSKVLYAGFTGEGAKLYRSTDAGATWSPVPGQPPANLMPHQAKIDNAGVLYLPYADAVGPNGISDGAVWKLDTRTGTWTDITPLRPNVAPETGFGYSGVDIDRRHPGTVVVTTNNRWGPVDDIFRSTDGGATWAGVAAKAVRDHSASPYLTFGETTTKLGWWLGAIAINPNRPGDVMYGTGATIWATDDITKVAENEPTKWYVRAGGLEETAVQDLISPPSGAHLLSAHYDLGGFRHDDLKASPRGGMFTTPVHTSSHDLDFAELKPETVVRVGTSYGDNERGAYSLDGGTTWTGFPTEPPTSQGAGNAAVSADGGTFVWTPRDGAPAFSRDRGATWTASTGLPAGPLAVVADRVDPRVFYTYDRATGTFYRSTDGAASFTAAATGLPDNSWQLDAVPGVPGELWLAAQAGGLWRSTDGGATFTKLSSVTVADNLGLGKAAPGKPTAALYSSAEIGGVRGVYRSVDTGATWARINDDEHQWGWTGNAITGDPRIFGRVYLGSNGRGVLYADTAGCLMDAR